MARTPAQDLLVDAFGRVAEVVAETLDGATDDVLVHRADADANTVAWLVWHLSRVADDHVADAAGTAQVWRGAGFEERFGLPLEPDDTGYGHDADQVAAVRVGAELLGEYHRAVHEAARAYVGRLDDDELARVVDDAWDPPVTVAVRLVSVLSDCLQHAGQASYARGLAERAG
ncbi:MAG TPA: DUF664 domain-containing protein [Aquihabitans sp.]|jgi:hypothetical protein|nr:DUF664 domain-containing protein [Aquihabitans sp.]